MIKLHYRTLLNSLNAFITPVKVYVYVCTR